MHNSIGINTWGKLCLIYHHRLIYFPTTTEAVTEWNSHYNTYCGKSNPPHPPPPQCLASLMLKPSCQKLKVHFP